LDTIFADIITFNKEDFASLIETRYFLEINSAKLAAERRTAVDIKDLTEALKEFDSKFTKGMAAVDEDLLFHINIAAASKNSVLESMILILVPDLINIISMVDCGADNSKKFIVDQHYNILNAIQQQNPDAAGAAMVEHLKDIMDRRFTICPKK